MADAWRDLVQGFDGVDPPLDLLQRVRKHEAGSPLPRHRGWRVPRALGWAVAAIAAVAVVATLALAAHSRRDQPAAGPVTASPEKLATLRTSFATPSYRQVSLASAEAGIRGLPIPLPRPNSPLASDRTLDSIWVARNSSAVLLWKSGIVETIRPWHCNASSHADCSFASFPSDFKRYTIGGSPAIAHSSDPDPPVFIGPETLAESKYGIPASVETVRSGFKVTLWWYGARTLPGLLDVARTLPAENGFGQIIDDPRMVITGGTPEQQKLLRSIVRGIDSNDVPKVEIGPPPAPYHSKGGTWLTFRMAGLKNDSELGIWETWLAAGAFRELSHLRGLPDVSGFGQSFADSTPGTQEGNYFPPDASHATSNIGAETLTATIERNLSKTHLILVSLRFAKPFNLAPIVITRTDDPRAGNQGWVPELNPIGDDGELEGGFFEVVDASGKVVFFVGHATRTQSGIGSTGHGHLPYIPTQ